MRKEVRFSILFLLLIGAPSAKSEPPNPLDLLKSRSFYVVEQKPLQLPCEETDKQVRQFAVVGCVATFRDTIRKTDYPVFSKKCAFAPNQKLSAVLSGPSCDTGGKIKCSNDLPPLPINDVRENNIDCYVPIFNVTDKEEVERLRLQIIKRTKDSKSNR